MYTTMEEQRLLVQQKLDSSKTQIQKNKLGQFATPTELAHDILLHAKSYFPQKTKIQFLDPAFGTGAFYAAFLRVFPHDCIERAVGFEIDRDLNKAATLLYRKSPLITIHNQDFTKAFPQDTDKFNLVICNPPYVRHHHLLNEDKRRLQMTIQDEFNVKLSGLAGYYCYFILLSIKWMDTDGIAGWLLPSEFMDVNYGQVLKEILTERVQLIHVHRFCPEDVQFKDALVSSTVLWFRNVRSDKHKKIKVTYGGTISAPKTTRLLSLESLKKEKKWTNLPFTEKNANMDSSVLSDFFEIKRGIATGDNNFFILSQEQIQNKKLPKELFRPILPSPRFLSETIIEADDSGEPLIDRKLFLLDCPFPEKDIKNRYHQLWTYLLGGEKNAVNERYLCKNRSPWYSQETRAKSHFYCTYIGRSDNRKMKPFRFILNYSDAIVSNSYLILYPKIQIANLMTNNLLTAQEIWNALNNIPNEFLLSQGRVYGGGLYKLEPRELSNVSADIICKLLQGLQDLHNKEL
ncbi:MAG: N-6 DNA methylase [Magnetococcales bacterium]|nr:N-6 DNA methylase [Nitrospirota bacterium]